MVQNVPNVAYHLTTMEKLRNLSQSSLQSVFLVNDEDVSEEDVTRALTSIEGMNFDEVWMYLDDLAHRRSWNMSTRIAAFEGLELAKENTYH